ncbi:MAG: MBL fold metallo-hydrolase [Pseudomonadota bacterium]
MAHEKNPAEALLRPLKERLDVLSQPRLRLAENDHFNGSRFFNPWLRTGHGLRDALRWMRTRKPAEWPQWQANGPAQVPPACFSQRLDDWQVTFVNHATVLIQIGPWNLLTDPVWSDRVSPLRQIGPRRVRNPGLRLDELPQIHAVLLSHDHYDHLDVRSLMWIARRDNPLVVTGLGVGAVLRQHGIERVSECDWWQSVELGPLTIHFVPAQHFSGRGARDRNRTLWGGLFVSSEAGSCFFAGDTGYGPHFAEIRERLGAPRLALLPIGAYEPRWFMGPVHMNPDDAVRAHVDLGARRSLSIHFNTFQLTDEAIEQPVLDLAAALQKHGVVSAAFAVLKEGSALRV